MKLNIYDEKMQNVTKTYESSTMRIPFGVAEDILGLVDGSLFSKDQKTQQQAIMTLIAKSFDEVKNLLSLIFPGITDEEIKNTDIMEIVAVLRDVLAYVMTMVGVFFGKN